MTELATLEVEAGETTIARLSGELDLSNTPQLAERLLDSMTNRARALLLDLRETTYLDSSGIQLIFDLAEKLRGRRQQLHLLVDEGSFVSEVLRTVGVTDVSRVHTELAKALRSAESQDRPLSER
jgi:anti-anti-sigma factor